MKDYVKEKQVHTETSLLKLMDSLLPGAVHVEHSEASSSSNCPRLYQSKYNILYLIVISLFDKGLTL